MSQKSELFTSRASLPSVLIARNVCLRRLQDLQAGPKLTSTTLSSTELVSIAVPRTIWNKD